MVELEGVIMSETVDSDGRFEKGDTVGVVAGDRPVRRS